MTLSPGDRLGHYEVVGQLGAGGMGEVYRARDTRLGRDVALKLIPEVFAGDPDRLARFEREARTLAALNHPHIAQIYGVEDSGPRRALVMELVEGPTLADRIASGTLPLAEVLSIARQLALALEAAHEQGIVHRDLKPANVNLTPDGTAKVLDFGLAKALDGKGRDGDLTSSPATTSPVTSRAGVILGTAGYMSPEQARGSPVDKRADIWAFGAILYEMLTGRQCFAGDTVTDVLAAVVKSEPDWTALPATTPACVRELLARCLAKDHRQRLHDIGDARLDLEKAITSDPYAAPEVHANPRRTSLRPGAASRRAAAVGAAMFVIGGISSGGLLWLMRSAAPADPGPVVHALLDVSPAESLDARADMELPSTPAGSRTALAWTPDGRSLVFIGRRGGLRQVYVRALDKPVARSLEGTEGAEALAVSPDGEWVAFSDGSSIKNAPIAGGAVSKILDDAAVPFSMAWGPAGILLDRFQGIALVRPGGQREPVTRVRADELRHTLPQWLPGGSAVLYTVRKRLWTWSGDQIVAERRETGERTVLLEEATDARLSAGHLVFLRRGLLFAVPFEPRTLQLRGEPVAMVSDVSQAVASAGSEEVTGAGQYAISGTGSLAYVASPPIGYPEFRLVAVNRKGVVTETSAPPRAYGTAVRMSPDGGRVLLPVFQPSERALWIHDLTRAGSLAKVAAAGGEVGAGRLWTPDGRRVTFGWTDPSGNQQIAWQPADGSGLPEALASKGVPCQWTPDGRDLIGLISGDIWVLASRAGGTGIRPIVQSQAHEQHPALSPDGRWLAFTSDTTGRREVYVKPYPGQGAPRQVSVEGGTDVAWHPSGRELFFISSGTDAGIYRMMSVLLETGEQLRLGLTRTLFQFTADLAFQAEPVTAYAVAPDGQRFFVMRAVPKPPLPPVTHIHLILNWLEEVRSRVPRTG